jgi:hypothetical protein
VALDLRLPRYIRSPVRTADPSTQPARLPPLLRPHHGRPLYVTLARPLAHPATRRTPHGHRRPGRRRERAGRLGPPGCAAGDNNTGTGPGRTPSFNQVQRLGNPLIGEVLLDKRSHSTHGLIGPDQDAALVGPEIFGHLVLGSPTSFAGCDGAYVGGSASVLPAHHAPHGARTARGLLWPACALG